MKTIRRGSHRQTSKHMEIATYSEHLNSGGNAEETDTATTRLILPRGGRVK